QQQRMHADFFFQAEDGIRDLIVTGVQTCALPISSDAHSEPSDRMTWQENKWDCQVILSDGSECASEAVYRIESDNKLVCLKHYRSEERRVGKECRGRWCGEH